MKFCLIVVVTLIAALGFDVVASNAQNNSREFIESSSPLASGDRVISRSEPGREIQTVITVSAESLSRRSATAANDRLDLPNFSSPATRGAVQTASAETSGRYPYPAANRFSYGSLNAGSSGATFQPMAYQMPTLGIGSVRTARFSNCNCGRQTFGAGPTAPLATQVPALQSPSLTIQDPGQLGVALQQPGVAQPVIQQPQFAYQNNGSWWNPIVTGSGVYQPIVRLANVQPGTYLGQGIVGQPTAYVDGQPIRNLMRYIFP